MDELRAQGGIGRGHELLTHSSDLQLLHQFITRMFSAS